VVVSRYVARITRAPVPLVQIALGAAIFYAHVIEVDLDPEVFFVLLLPPLLFLDGWRIPKDQLLREAPTILTLALAGPGARHAGLAAPAQGHVDYAGPPATRRGEPRARRGS